MFQYDEAFKRAPKSLKRLISIFHGLSNKERSRKPLLYWLLGTGTPSYKISQEDSKYVDKAPGTNRCNNCEFLYLKIASGKHICSQIRGHVLPAGWCDRWKESDH